MYILLLLYSLRVSRAVGIYNSLVVAAAERQLFDYNLHTLLLHIRLYTAVAAVVRKLIKL